MCNVSMLGFSNMRHQEFLYCFCLCILYYVFIIEKEKKEKKEKFFHSYYLSINALIFINHINLFISVLDKFRENICEICKNFISFHVHYFKGIKFRGFRGFRKNREIKSRRKICNGSSAKLNPHKKKLKKTNPRNFQILFKQTYTVFIRYRTYRVSSLD